MNHNLSSEGARAHGQAPGQEADAGDGRVAVHHLRRLKRVGVVTVYLLVVAGGDKQQVIDRREGEAVAGSLVALANLTDATAMHVQVADAS